MSDLYLTEKQFSERFRVPLRTVQRWREDGDCPPYLRLGKRRVVYRASDVEEWAAKRTYASRAAEAAGRAVA